MLIIILNIIDTVVHPYFNYLLFELINLCYIIGHSIIMLLIHLLLIIVLIALLIIKYIPLFLDYHMVIPLFVLALTQSISFFLYPLKNIHRKINLANLMPIINFFLFIYLLLVFIKYISTNFEFMGIFLFRFLFFSLS